MSKNEQSSLDTALCKAASSGDLERVNTLLKEGADVTANDGNAFWMSSWYGHSEVATRLALAGADVDRCNDDASFWARMRNDKPMMRCLANLGRC